MVYLPGMATVDWLTAVLLIFSLAIKSGPQLLPRALPASKRTYWSMR